MGTVWAKAALGAAGVIALGAAVVLGVQLVPDGPRPDIKHVVIISIDTLRADHLGCYGHPYVKSPNIDALAEDGIVFDQFIASAPTTLASHTSLMTGKYPRSHGAPRNGYIVPDANEMLAEVLRDHGYATAGIIGAFPLHSRFNFNQGFKMWNQRFPPKRGVKGEIQRPAIAVTRTASRWLRERWGGKPLFLFAHYFDVHAPYAPPEPYDRMYRDDDLPIDGHRNSVRLVRRKIAGRGPKAEAYNDALARAYAGGVTYTDVHVGKLLDNLDDLGVLDEALVVLTSDHGEGFDEHRSELWNHGLNVYDETIRVPLILRFPNGWGGGRRVEQLVSNVDVFPTILELLGYPASGEIDGHSFVSLLDGDPTPIRQSLFAEATQPRSARYEEGQAWANDLKPHAVRTDTWKYIESPLKERTELFNLRRDPYEQHNLASATALTKAKSKAAKGRIKAKRVLRTAEKLAAELKAWVSQERTTQTGEEDLSEDSVEALKALGYVE